MKARIINTLRKMTVLLSIISILASSMAFQSAAVNALTTSEYTAQEKDRGKAAPSDFNGDRIADLAVGVPGEDVNGEPDAGAINVIYGTPYGLGAKCNRTNRRSKPKKKAGVPVAPTCVMNLPDNQYFDESLLGGSSVPGQIKPEKFDHFGEVLAYGDFNGDGYCDLAIGVPDEDVWMDTEFGGDGLEHNDVGQVVIIYGTMDGLNPEGTSNIPGKQILSYATFDELASYADDFSRFGAALAAGDFNGDDVDDLAIGCPGYNTAKPPPFEYDEDAGQVFVMYGERYSGLSDAIPSPRKIKRIKSSTSFDVDNQPYQKMGYSLEAGDFNGDNVDDLAIGIPFRDDRFVEDVGAVAVVFGSKDGLVENKPKAPIQKQYWLQEYFDNPSGRVGITAQKGSRFGSVLAAGDFDGNKCDDLAIGIPFAGYISGSDGIEIEEGGAINVLYGSTEFGLRHNYQGSDGHNVKEILGIHAIDEQSFMRLGSVLAAGDINGDGFDELAAGMPGYDSKDVSNSGIVLVFYGSSSEGLRDFGRDNENLDIPGVGVFDQQSFDIGETCEVNDSFGASLVILDFGKDSKSDIAIGAPREGREKNILSGIVHVLYGAAQKINGIGSEIWEQGPKVPGGRENTDRFGGSVK